MDTPRPAAGVWADLTAAENVLRDLIEETLEAAYGDDWLLKSGLTDERIVKLRAALTEEQQRRDGGEVNPRLIYYTQIWDLETILDKHWPKFAECLGDHKTMRVYLGRLVSFRNPEMHGRDLLPFEEHLVLGITGEIRNKVTIYRSRKSGDREYFPRIEYAGDSFGNVASRNDQGNWKAVETGLRLHPGDRVEFQLRAWDPEGKGWRWKAISSRMKQPDGLTTDGDRFVWIVGENEIAERQEITFYLYSERGYHRRATFDDAVTFAYSVMPSE